MLKFNTSASFKTCSPQSLERFFQAIPRMSKGMMTGLVATVFCCLLSQNISAQCDIGYGGPAMFDLSLDVNGSAAINSTLFEPFVTSSFAQCLPANGADLDLWMDSGATMAFPNPSFYDCTNVGHVITVWVTLDDQGPGSQSAAIKFTVTITDDLDPLLAEPADQTFPADPNTCASFQTLTAIVTENCPGSLSTSHKLDHNILGFLGTFPGLTASHAYNVGTTTITWFAVDGGANDVTKTTTVTVTDGQAPQPNGAFPSSSTEYVNGSCVWPVSGLSFPTISDNCDVSIYRVKFTYPNGTMSTTNINPVTGVPTGSPNAFPTTLPLGMTNAVITYGDGVQNTNVPFSITVEDNTNPVFAAAPTMENIGTVDCFAPIVAPALTRSATDNCDPSVSISFIINVISIAPGGVIVLDNPAQNNGNANGSYPVGVYEIVYTAEDNEGNTATHTVTLTVTDNIDPEARCQDITVSLDANGNRTVMGVELDDALSPSSDNCGVTQWQIRPAPPGGSPWFDSMTFDCSDQGDNDVQFRVLDAGGNASNPPVCLAKITVVDDLPPVAQCQDITVELDLPAGPSPNNTNVYPASTHGSPFIDNGSEDNCKMPLVNYRLRKGTSGPFGGVGAPLNFTCAELGPNLVELRVGDGNGNPNFCTATVWVNDVTKPVPMCNPVTFDLDATTGTLNLLDPDPDPAAETTYPGPGGIAIPDLSTITTTVNVPTPTLVGDLDVYVDITHTWTEDLQISLTSPKGTTVLLYDQDCSGGGPNFDITFDDEGTDPLCPPNLGLTSIPLNSLSAFDGENMQGDWILTISDVISGGPGTLNSWSLTLTDSYMTKLGAGSTDNCCVMWTANKLTYDCSNVNVGFGGNGPLTYTLTAFDSNADGNAETATCTQSITIRDVTDPTPVCPSTPIDVYLDALGTVSVSASLVGAGSTDNCSIAAYLINYIGTSTWKSSLTYDCDSIGLRSVRLWVDDPSGNPTDNNPPPILDNTTNTVLCTNAINVIDNIAPLAICNAVSVALGSDGMVTVPAMSVSLGSTDNCNPCVLTREVSMDGSPWGPNAVYNCDSLGARNVAVRITDCNMNSAICTTTITIQDNEDPVITCPSNVTIECDDSLDPNINGLLGFATATDNCPKIEIDSMDSAPYNILCVGSYTITRTWKATDGQNNMDQCDQIITVEDVTAPTFTAPGDVTLDCPESYQVANHTCVFYDNDTDVAISDIGTPTERSSIPVNVPANGKVSDVNVQVEISHTFIGDVSAHLEYYVPGLVPGVHSPTEVVALFSGLCGNYEDLDLAFDDGGLSLGSVPCPPTDQSNAYDPDGSLADFIGKFINGTWVLRVSDGVNGNGGAITYWSLDICYVPQEGVLTASGDVTDEFDNCDTPQAIPTDYEAFKDFAWNEKNTTPSSTIYDFRHSNWVSTISPIPPGPPALPLLENGLSTSLTMRSHLTASGNSNQYQYGPTIPADGWIMFDYNKIGDNGDQFRYYVNGAQTTINGSGRAVVRVFSGDTFGFRQRSNGNANQATTVITNFVYIDEDICPVPAFDCPREFCIARIWTLEDDCGNKAAPQIQIIRTQDVTAPTTTFPTTMTMLPQMGICAPLVDLDLSAAFTDMCTDNGALDITNNASTLYGKGNGLADASGNYPPGNYTITFWVRDECDNLKTHIIDLTVTDDQDPVAKCESDINVQLDNTGTAIVTVPDIDKNSIDNCAITSYMLSAPGHPSGTSLTFDINDIGVVPVTLTVFDAAGNDNSCMTLVTVIGGVLFDVVNASGTNGALIPVPVVVSDFQDIISFGMDFNITDGAVAEFVAPGAIAVDPGLAFGFLATFVNSTTVHVQWIGLETDIPDGDVAFNLNVLLTGTPGSSTPITIDNDEVGKTSGIVPSLGLSGTVTVLNPGAPVTISGTLQRETACGNDPIHLVDVDYSFFGSPSGSTPGTGAYSFSAPSGTDVTIEPMKDINWNNGVTTLDASCVHFFSAGLPMPASCPTSLSPYARIAADANGNNSITAFDAALIQQIAVFNTAVNGNTSWRFVPDLPILPPDPFVGGFDEFRSYTNVTSDITDANFIGIKTGDINCTSSPTTLFNGNGNDDRGQDFIFSISDQSVEAGQAISVTFMSNDFDGVFSIQTTLNFDERVLELTSTSANGLTNAVFNTDMVADGKLAASWYNLDPVTFADGTELFTLNFTALQSGVLSEMLFASDDIVVPEVAKFDGFIMGVDLTFESLTSTGEIQTGHFALYQNRPNPFGHKTSIGFSLPEASKATLTVFEPSGRVLKVIEGQFTTGYHQVFVDREELPAHGVLFYRLETPTQQAVRKMILLD